ncbi:MAG TPA: phage baseplate assembly protein V [Acidimicrobiales bacterium]|nr:phage baseplate assembly protein V [Acidimicrobiales bacterium]
MPQLDLSPVIKVDGARISEERTHDVFEVRVEVGLNRIGWASLRMVDRAFTDDETTWDVGTALSIGNADGDTFFTGEITALTVEADGNLRRTITYTAQDRAHRLTRTAVARTFQETTASDRVTKIASAAGLATDVSSTSTTAPWATQAGTDLAMIDELARRVGFDWWVDPTGATPTFCFKKLEKKAATTLTYGEHLREFTLRKTGDLPTEVTVTGWDPKGKQTIAATASSASAGSNPAALSASKLGTGALKLTGIGRPVDQAEASTLANAIIDRITSSAVVFKGTLVQAPAIAPGHWVKIDGAGKTADGDYPVTAVEYIYRRGVPLTTRFTAGDRSPRTLADTLGGGASQPLAGAHEAVLLGVVTKNKDDDNLGRVKVKIPVLGDDYESGWARVVVTGGGASRGNFFHPEINDEVLVAFEGGDLARPLVLGGLHNSSDAYLPGLQISDGKVQQRTILSRTGHVLTFDDSGKDSEGILLQLQDKTHSIKLTPSKITITSTDGKPIELTSGEASLKIDGSSNSITMSAPQKISLQSNDALELKGTQVKVTADATLEMTAQATAKLAAQAQTEVSGSGMLALKGGMVQVN